MLGDGAERRVATNGAALHVRVRGDGAPAIVLLHYFAGSARSWDGVVDRLAHERRCVAVDLRGHGDSSAPEGGYAVGDGADDVAGVVAALGLESYALVGHSMGGKVALALAARQPLGLSALALVAPSPPTPEPIDDGERARSLSAHGDRGAAEATADRIVARPLTAAERERVVEDTLRTSAPAWHAWLADGSREDISARVGAVRVPTLVVVGDADRVLPQELHEREVMERVPGARLTVLPGVGHLVPVEAPAELAELLAVELRVDFATPQNVEPRG